MQPGQARDFLASIEPAMAKLAWRRSNLTVEILPMTLSLDCRVTSKAAGGA
jgi:hypothetical protein